MLQAYFQNIRSAIINELSTANKKIVIAVYWFTNEDLFEILLQKVLKGVEIQLIVHNDYINNRNTGLSFQKFIDAGGKFYFSDMRNPMHNKFCVIDDEILINGSYNWTYYAENKNRENIIIIKNDKELIKTYVSEFERLISFSQSVKEVEPLSRLEINDGNELSANNYLAHDLIFQAHQTGRSELAKTAFQLAPENINVQQSAFDCGMTKRRCLKKSIGSSLKDDKYLIVVPKGSVIPIQLSAIVKTSEDNQLTSGATIHYGENTIASKNPVITSMRVGGIPAKPAGEAKLKYNFSIDIYGFLHMTKIVVDTGRRQDLKENISHLLEDYIE